MKVKRYQLAKLREQPDGGLLDKLVFDVGVHAQNDVVRHARKRDTILRPAGKAAGGKMESSAASDTLTGVAQK